MLRVAANAFDDAALANSVKRYAAAGRPLQSSLQPETDTPAVPEEAALRLSGAEAPLFAFLWPGAIAVEAQAERVIAAYQAAISLAEPGTALAAQAIVHEVIG